MIAVGVLLMAAPVLWLCAILIQALRGGASHVAIDLVALFVMGLSWLAGRYIAGASLLTLALG